MSQNGFQTSKVSIPTSETMGFAESMEMLRRARSSFSGMCRVVTDESGIRIVPSFSPDQADWCGGKAEQSDWSLRVGFGGTAPARVIGTYDELCKEWLKGPESFHDWVGCMVLDAAQKIVDEEAPRHDELTDEPDVLPDPAARSVAEAKIGLMACGYIISPATIPNYMDVCSFVAWTGDTLTFVAVTDDEDVSERSRALAHAVARWKDEGHGAKTDIKGMVVEVDNGKLSTTDVAL